MRTDQDIYCSAQLIIKQHGCAAENYAIDMYHEFLARDDVRSAATWLAIADAILKLQQQQTWAGQIH